MSDLPLEPTVRVPVELPGREPWVRIDCETCGERVGRVGHEYSPHSLRDCVRVLRDELRGDR